MSKLEATPLSFRSASVLLMSYQLHSKHPLAPAIRAVARAQVHAAIACCQSAEDGHAIHSVRKHGKKLRALLRLIRYANATTDTLYHTENTRYRSINAALSACRESASLYLALDTQLHAKRFPQTAAYLKGRLDNGHTERLLEQAEKSLQLALIKIDGWHFQGASWDAIELGYCKSYRRAFKAMGHAFALNTDKRFHTLRKRVKDQWYQSRLLEEHYPETIGTRTRGLQRLASALGDWRDLRLLCQHLARYGDDAPEMANEQRALLKQAKKRLEQLRNEIEQLCRQLFPKAHWAFA
ncbi:CHAD domain-containing protein [Microbulbifer agarilyticus]